MELVTRFIRSKEIRSIKGMALGTSSALSKANRFFKAMVQDMDREDLRIVCYLNRIDTMLHCKTPVGLNSCEWNTCILFTHALIYTISSHDYTAYRGGFFGNGVLFIPLPHHAGTDDSLEITIDEFDEWFQKFCEGYQRSKRRMRRLHWRFD